MEALSSSEFYGSWEQIRPQKNYNEAAAFVVGDETRFKINFGGQNIDHGPNVVGTGHAAQMLADVIRGRFPHRVSRLDSCEDYYHPDAYDYLRRAALKIAKDQKIQCREIVKPLPESDDGRTLYLGSQTSVVSMRIYEKGKQLGADDQWVRAELQLRPQKDVKHFASLMDSTEVWGLSKWSHAMALQLGKSGLQRVHAQVYQPSDHDRQMVWMLKQYRKLFEHLLAVHGSAEAVGAQIFYDLANPIDVAGKTSLKPVKGV